MANKKVTLLCPPELYKAAKLKAAENNQSLAEWVVDLIREQCQDESKHTSTALDWGRIDDRIDQRTAILERQIEILTEKIEYLLKEQVSQRSLEKQNFMLDSKA